MQNSCQIVKTAYIFVGVFDMHPPPPLHSVQNCFRVFSLEHICTAYEILLLIMPVVLLLINYIPNMYQVSVKLIN